MWFSKSQIRKCERAHLSAFRAPVPSRMVSNGEYMPVLQTPDQKRVDEKIIGMADANSKRGWAPNASSGAQTQCGTGLHNGR